MLTPVQKPTQLYQPGGRSGFERERRAGILEMSDEQLRKLEKENPRSSCNFSKPSSAMSPRSTSNTQNLSNRMKSFFLPLWALSARFP